MLEGDDSSEFDGEVHADKYSIREIEDGTSPYDHDPQLFSFDSFRGFHLVE